MKERTQYLSAEPKALGDNPLSKEDILTDFYRPQTGSKKGERNHLETYSKPNHYKIVCLSLYTEDIEKLNFLVKELKKRGHSKANKSQVVRAALEQIDIGRIPNTR